MYFTSLIATKIKLTFVQVHRQVIRTTNEEDHLHSYHRMYVEQGIKEKKGMIIVTR